MSLRQISKRIPSKFDKPCSALASHITSLRTVTQRPRAYQLTQSSRHITQSTPTPNGKAILEVERKFAPTPESIRLLDTNGGTPPFSTLQRKGVTSIDDAYFDRPTHDLARQGIYLRRRDGRWGAKSRVGGDYITSAFKEATEINEISCMLATVVPGAGLEESGPTGGLVQVARFVSNRVKYLVNDKFTVVIDVTDFGHTVGEVELETNFSEEMTRGALCEELRKQMDLDIEDFMNRHGWAFPQGKPMGKLTAYFITACQSTKGR